MTAYVKLSNQESKGRSSRCDDRGEPPNTTKTSRLVRAPTFRGRSEREADC